jgi:hypothetical protein
MPLGTIYINKHIKDQQNNLKTKKHNVEKQHGPIFIGMFNFLDLRPISMQTLFHSC